MGTDVHDKLLILQALRQYFPEKVFFTTDLQAIYQQPENYEWTHNMIIASHFGLQLRGELQGSIPPFRDSYQTALYSLPEDSQFTQRRRKRNTDITGLLPGI